MPIIAIPLFALLGCLTVSLASANEHPWSKLTPIQREALQPLSKQWDSLPDKYQRDMLALTLHYPALNPEQKARLRNRLQDWNRLTPQQRAAAREKYTAFSKVPPDKREEVKAIVRKQQTERNASSNPLPQ